LNGAYVLMGLLYGKQDLDQTIIISTRCGQDSDCNPANSGGVLFTTVGFAKLPERFTSALDPKGKFSHTPYDFPTLVEVSKKLVRQALVRSGGQVEQDANGDEVFVIPVVDPKPSQFEPVYRPGPAAGSKFTAEERAQITAKE
nr:ADP-ribosylglycohydrolase family protein [Pirellulaceae bacterium]